MNKIGILIIVIVFTLACNKKEVKSKLNSPIKLKVGQSAIIESEDLKITIKDIADSRCPEDLQCFWIGEALAYVSVNNVDFHISSNHITDTLGYSFTFSLTPYPKVKKEIKIRDYTIELNITK